MRPNPKIASRQTFKKGSECYPKSEPLRSLNRVSVSSASSGQNKIITKNFVLKILTDKLI